MNSPQQGSPDPRTGPARGPGVVWVCPSCDHTCEPSPADLAGEPPPCPHCDGWTAIGELAEPNSRPQPPARGLAHHSIGVPRSADGHRHNRSRSSTTSHRAAPAARSPDSGCLPSGFTGTNRARPGLEQALAAVRVGGHVHRDQARSAGPLGADALTILGQLSERGVRFALAASAYEWHDPFAPGGPNNGPVTSSVMQLAIIVAFTAVVMLVIIRTRR
ncbi:MAG: hypothetical protein ACRDS0_34170 [Pseudonocardiaceae bacterium]